ncbi:MAG: DUF6616 family protein [Acinetobacter guillouiae]
MNHYLIELYTPNAVWQALPIQERQQYLADVGAAMGGLSSLGVELLTLTEIDTAVDQSSHHRFMGIWHDYFDHVNAAGTEGDFQQHLDALAKF